MSRFYSYGNGIARELEAEIKSVQASVRRARTLNLRAQTIPELQPKVSQALKAIEDKIQLIIDERQPTTRNNDGRKKEFICGTIEQARKHYREGIRIDQMDPACRDIYRKTNANQMRERRATAKKNKEIAK